MTDDPENIKFLDYLTDELAPQKLKVPPLYYWKHNVMGIKVLVEKLFMFRFVMVNTKCFNVDNVLYFFNMIRAANKIKPDNLAHENIPYPVLDDTITSMCLVPSATYSLVPNEDLITSGTTTSGTSTGSTATTDGTTSKE